MSSRAEKLEQLHKSLKKHFKYQEDSTERTVLENLLYACCLEDSRPEQADEAFAKLQQTYFDWNEVRVSTVIELGEVLGNLPNANAAGHRIKRCLQSLFETRYQYDIDDLKKANLSKATEELQAWPGMTPFVLNYVSQHALGGHAIPVGTASFDALLAADIVTPAEAEKKTLPGAERAITKTKGAEFSSLLHQFGVEYAANPKSAAALAVFKDLGVTPKPPIVVDTSKTKKAKAPPPEQLAAPKPTKGVPSKDASKGAASVKPDSVAATKVETKNTGAKETAAKDSAAKEETKKESKPAAKGTEDKTKEAKPKADAGKTASKPADKSSKADVASKSVSKPAPSPKSKSSDGKATEGKGVEGKGADKAEAKKPAAAPKKPTKMANNVKITKKKPK